jgi:hypothetical protein
MNKPGSFSPSRILGKFVLYTFINGDQAIIMTLEMDRIKTIKLMEGNTFF